MATIKDIAKIANVTIGTVSRALNNEAGVGDKTRERIMQIAKELNYSRSVPSKRPVEQEPTKSIGIIWHRANGLFFSHLCNQLEIQANVRGYSIIVSFANPDRAFQLLHRHSVDHILCWSMSSWVPTYQFLKIKEQFRGSMLLLGGAPIDQAHRINIDRKGAIFQAVSHLAELGHSRIGYIGTENEKLIGFTMGVLELKLDYKPDTIVTVDKRSPFPDDRLLELMNRPPESRPTAYIVDSQGNFFRFVHFIRKYGFRVPDDFSLIVYDAIAEMEFAFDVPLTTVGPNVEKLAKSAIGLLLDNDGNRSGDKIWHDVTTSSEIVVRGSTAPPK